MEVSPFPRVMLATAQRASIFHRAQIEASTLVGCFFCKTTYASDRINEWTDDERPEHEWTAACRNCGTDAVIGDAAGYPLSRGFLVAMKAYWFLRTVE
jgi:hypothetical protein